MEHFLKEIWRQCGMRVFVLSAWKNEQGEVLFRMHDDNEALGDGDSFMKMKDWEDIEPVWQEYAQEQFGAGAWDGGRQVKGGHKRVRQPAFELNMDRDGMPLLPDITETKLEEKKVIVRAFLTSHYKICSGNDKAVVPWSAIVQSQDDFVARKYLPADIDLKEPLKLQNWDMTALLISEAESDTDSDTHHKEDDIDDDSADGRSPLKKPRQTAHPSSAPKETEVPCSMLKPGLARPAKTGALLTSWMGDLLARLTEEVEERNTSPEPRSIWGKKAVIEPSTRTTQSKSQKPV
ncbi:hypothetical protein BDR07DRAFT_1482637 [Suillus spraguei]|nr:hypothetical protein BDR07DRAFT_1482637 [Suillus spraguei]